MYFLLPSYGLTGSFPSDSTLQRSSWENGPMVPGLDLRQTKIAGEKSGMHP